METVIILDFGGQYSQLIARRVRECHVYCEIKPYNLSVEQIKAIDPIGIILSGGPNSVYDSEAPKIDLAVFNLNIPILGICYGCQLMAQLLGGKVINADSDNVREYGKTQLNYKLKGLLFEGLPNESIVWMSHGDYIETLPSTFLSYAYSKKCCNAAIADQKRRLYGVQFHPEVSHTEHGEKIIDNFLVKICGAQRNWTMKNYMQDLISQLREQMGKHQVLLALSGGVDSTVTAALLSKAIGKQLTCIFVDHGLMRQDEGDQIEACFNNWEINFVRINAETAFLNRLSGIEDPEEKRKIIGEEFIKTFEQVAKKIGKIDFLAQGTIYPDVIESGLSNAVVIKSHHNVGGLPKVLKFKAIIEPLRKLFKDEVRQLGKELNLPLALINRQPFPGPGLAIRIIGEVTKAKLTILRAADYIFRRELEQAQLSIPIYQYFTVLTSMRSVGVMGDQRTYDYVLALRAVHTSDFMTADWVRIPYEILDRISRRIINEVKGINRIVYDITSKPPATIEFE